MLAKWVGMKLTKEEASELSGIKVQDVLYNGSFNDYMKNHLQVLRYANQVANTLYLDLEKHDNPLYDTFALNYAHKVQTNYPAINIKDIYAQIIQMRMQKDEKEVELIVESIETTNNAILEVMKNHKALDNEQTAEAYYDFINRKEGKNISFTRDNKKILEFDFTGFPYLAIWSKPDAPFVCIEPWFNTADKVNSNGIFEEKEVIKELANIILK